MKRDFKISKELFEAVFGAKIMILSIVGRKGSKFIQYAYGYTGVHTLSVNDFFFMCKEWSAVQEIIIISEFSFGNKCNGQSTVKINGTEAKYFESDSEQQAVFDACQWIIENKGS